MDLTPKPFLANLSGGYYVLDYGFEFTGSRPVSGERALHVNYIVNEVSLRGYAHTHCESARPCVLAPVNYVQLNGIPGYRLGIQTALQSGSHTE